MKNYILFLFVALSVCMSTNANDYYVIANASGEWAQAGKMDANSDGTYSYYLGLTSTDGHRITYFAVNDGTFNDNDWSNVLRVGVSNLDVLAHPTGELNTYKNSNSGGVFYINLENTKARAIELRFTIDSNGKMNYTITRFLVVKSSADNWACGDNTLLLASASQTEDIYTAEVELGTEYKFLGMNVDGSDTWWGLDSNGKLSTSGNNITVEEEGIYTVTVNLDTYEYSAPDQSTETVTIGSSGYSTYVCSRSLNFSSSKVSNISSFTAADEGNGSALLTKIEKPKAGTAMLLKGEQGSYNVPVIADTKGTSVSTNAFIAGTGDYVYQKTGDMYNYILHSGQFYAANGNKVAANKAYLQLSKNTEAKPVTLIYADEESVPTGIVSIASKAEGEPCYNLQGMRVETLRKSGLYLRGGKKFVVK